MQPDAVLSLFRSVGALLEGPLPPVLGPAQQRLHAVRARAAASRRTPPRSARALADAVRALDPQVVLSPALGGLIIGHEVARGLGVRAIFAERSDGVLTLRRGFSLAAGERVLVVEDVVTTGSRRARRSPSPRPPRRRGRRRGDHQPRRRRRSRRAVRSAGDGVVSDLAGRPASGLAGRDSGHQARLAARKQGLSFGEGLPRRSARHRAPRDDEGRGRAGRARRRNAGRDGPAARSSRSTRR